MADSLLALCKYRLDTAQTEPYNHERLWLHDGWVDLTNAQRVRLLVNIDVSETMPSCPSLSLG